VVAAVVGDEGGDDDVGGVDDVGGDEDVGGVDDVGGDEDVGADVEENLGVGDGDGL
jgi:hypothetical protein